MNPTNIKITYHEVAQAFADRIDQADIFTQDKKKALLKQVAALDQMLKEDEPAAIAALLQVFQYR
jgi:hypothetical protein